MCSTIEQSDTIEQSEIVSVTASVADSVGDSYCICWFILERKEEIMSSGIQSLLKTEKEAAEIVNEARKYRTNRLKTAKQDAQQEIEDYKKSKEKELQKYEKEHEGINEQIDKDADVEVETELKHLKEQFEKKKSDVVKLLVEATITSHPSLHINATK
ncbi:VMA10 [Candida oxycetoniae]|uniref:V-type proton ATPase subunit G n=1 Tax=Candida oxycetoniae TaxID=497107 RepID=A0AAI9SV85_9ASCO|nr:VMA10 [Candida oxycetoniae]KAI3403454.2 VMA10 [Candida oxycetoniae]